MPAACATANTSSTSCAMAYDGDIVRPRAGTVSALIECDDAITVVGQQVDQRQPHRGRLRETMQQHDARPGVVESGDARAKFEAVGGDANQPGVRGCVEQWQRGRRGGVVTIPIQRHQTAAREYGQQRDDDHDQHDDETANQSHARVRKCFDAVSLVTPTWLVSIRGCADTAPTMGGSDMKFKALAIDLDGTLLVGEHVPADNVVAVRAARDAGLQDHHCDRAVAPDGVARRERTGNRRTGDRVFRRAGSPAGRRSRHLRRTAAGGLRRRTLQAVRRRTLRRDGHRGRSRAAETRRRTGSRRDAAGNELGAAARPVRRIHCRASPRFRAAASTRAFARSSSRATKIA